MDVSPTIATSDEAFCAEILPKVSRTFALSIEALPESLRATVRVAYLLCRIVDTIEDERDLAAERRRRLFAAFDAQVADDHRDPSSFEAACRDLGRPGGERTLMRRSGAAFRAFRGLPTAAREAVRPHVLEMSHGMRAYAERADAEGGLHIHDVDDLERYCYFVAGTVGNLLTALFEQAVPDLTEDARRLAHENAVRFGLGLQLVNIVKDVAADHARGDCFLPESLAARHGITLDRILEPDVRDRGLEVVLDVSRRAREHLAHAETYTLAWPVPAAVDVRLFCAVPLALALATLAEVERGTDVLRPGTTPKVDRETVFRVLASARAAVQDDDALRALFAAYSGPALD